MNERQKLEARRAELEGKEQSQLTAAEKQELKDIAAKLAELDAAEDNPDPEVNITIRVPGSVWSEVSKAAKVEGRSKNAQVVELLKRASESGDGNEVAELSALLQVLPEGDSEMRSAVRAKLTECLAKRHGIKVAPEPEPPQPKRKGKGDPKPEPEPEPYDAKKQGERRGKGNDRRGKDPFKFFFGDPPKDSKTGKRANRRVRDRREIAAGGVQ